MMILPLNELNSRLLEAHALMEEALTVLSIADISDSARHHGLGSDNAASPLAVRAALQTAYVRCEAATLWIRALQHDEKEKINAKL